MVKWQNKHIFISLIFSDQFWIKIIWTFLLLEKSKADFAGIWSDIASPHCHTGKSSSEILKVLPVKCYLKSIKQLPVGVGNNTRKNKSVLFPEPHARARRWSSRSELLQKLPQVVCISCPWNCFESTSISTWQCDKQDCASLLSTSKPLHSIGSFKNSAFTTPPRAYKKDYQLDQPGIL